jgi:hypothetical protein
MSDFKIGDIVLDPMLGKGEVVRLNMSGPIVLFDDYKSEMCVPEWALVHFEGDKEES